MKYFHHFITIKDSKKHYFNEIMYEIIQNTLICNIYIFLKLNS